MLATHQFLPSKNHLIVVISWFPIYLYWKYYVKQQVMLIILQVLHFRLTLCPTLTNWVKMSCLSHSGHSPASTVWTQNKSISHKQNPGPLSPFCSWERESIKGGIVTQMSSLSLTKFILWSQLRRTGQRACHWPELPTSAAVCSPPLLRYDYPEECERHCLFSAVWAADWMGRLCLSQICYKTDQNR